MRRANIMHLCNVLRSDTNLELSEGFFIHSNELWIGTFQTYVYFCSEKCRTDNFHLFSVFHQIHTRISEKQNNLIVFVKTEKKILLEK